MNKSVVYSDNSVQVEDPNKGNIVIYAHPEDVINLDFDLAFLKKELVNGDLVITTNSGGTVTIANYSIMFMQKQIPIIVDSLSQRYGYNDFLDDAKAFSSSDNTDLLVINRTVSTAKATEISENFLASGKEILFNEYDQKELIGMIELEEQSPILSSDVFSNPNTVLTLYPEGIDKNDTSVVYTYAGRTILNQEEVGNKPVVVRNSNPQISPLYGTSVVTSLEGNTAIIKALAGGGKMQGNDYSSYMYSPELLDYSSSAGSIHYEAYNGKQIQRGINLKFLDSATFFDNIIIRDVPEGIKFISTSTTEVQPLGNNAFQIISRSQSNAMDIYFVYNEANAIDAYGNPIGLKQIMQECQIEVTGFNPKYQQIVNGKSTVTFDFREVHGDEDINNFSMYNTFTFSTLFDPLIVRTSNYDDYIVGGVTSHIYDLLQGNNIFIGGDGNDTVYMGEGSSEYEYKFGNDRVDAKATMNSIDNPTITGTDTLKFNYGAYVDKTTGSYNFNRDVHIALDNGYVKVNNNAKNSKNVEDNSYSEFKNFDLLYLESDEQQFSQINNEITINSTKGFYGFQIFAGSNDTTNGQSGNILNLGLASLIDFSEENGAYISSVLLRTNPEKDTDFDKTQKIYFSSGNGSNNKNIFTTIRGSEGNDYYLASDHKNYDVYFDGKQGRNTIDFSLVANTSVVYDVVSGSAEYSGQKDTLINIGVFIGSKQYDTVYASGVGSMTFYMSPEDISSSAGNVVSYERFAGIDGKGVEIDYVVGKDSGGFIQVDKYGRGKDVIYGSPEIKASQANDIFYLSMSNNYSINGIAGKNTMDYSKDISSTGIIVNVKNVGTNSDASGSINKASYVDNFVYIQSIIGTNQNDTFLISGDQRSSMHYDGRGGYNTIDYSDIKDGIRINYNISKEELTKVYISTNERIKDDVIGFSSLIGTKEDDMFIAEDNAWQTASNVIYDGNVSKYNPSKEITLNSYNELENAGNVLYLNYEIKESLNLPILSSKFINFDTLRLGDFNNEISYSDTNFKVFWGSTNKNVKTVFNASVSASQVDFSINGNKAEVGTLTLYNFDILKASDFGSVFKVKVGSDRSKDYEYSFIGGQSVDALDYTGSQVDLRFDLGKTGAYDQGSVTKEYKNSNNKDYFTNIDRFTGGNGDDVFILNPYKTSYYIDGGAGNNNTISYENYLSPVTQADIDYTMFTNIQAFRLTNFDDVWFINSEARGETKVDGGGGFDKVLIGADVKELKYTISDKVVLNITSPTSSEHHLKQFEVLNGTNAGSNPTSSDKVIMETSDNKSILKNSYTNDGYFYFILNNGDLDYSKLDKGVTVEIFSEKTVAPGVRSSLLIDKQEGNADYYLGVKNIKLTNFDDTIRLDLSDPEVFENLKIDAGGGKNTIDYSSSSFGVKFDAVAETLDGKAFSIKNWSVLKAGDGDNSFILDPSKSKDLEIISGFGTSTIDFSKFSADLVFNFESSQGELFSVTQGTTNIVKASGVSNIKGGSGNDYFYGISLGSYNIDGQGGTNTLDYSKSIDVLGFSFELKNEEDSFISKGSSNNIDRFSNIDKIIGTNRDDYFTISSENKVKYIDAGGGRNELLVEAVVGSNQGFNFDLDKKELSGGGFSGIIKIDNFSVLNGSVNDDIFTFSSDEVLKQRGEIIGGGGNNTLNAKIRDSNGNNVGLYIDLSSGIFYRNNKGTAVRDEHLTVSKITNINLGDGDDILLFSGELTSSNYKVDLGGGNNLISFEKVNYSLSGTFDEMLNQVTNGTTLNVKGNYGLKLTMFSDTLKIKEGEKAVLVDGAGGVNTVDYSDVSSKLYMSLLSANNNELEVSRQEASGTKTDKLYSFSKFILGKGDDYIEAGGSSATEIDGNSGTNTISYEKLETGLIANLEAGTVFKIEHKTVDRIRNFQIFKGSLGNDIVYASKNVKEIWGNKGNDTLNLSKLSDSRISFSSLNDSEIKVTHNDGSFNIKKEGGSVKDTSYKRVVFGNNQTANIELSSIDNREYVYSSGSINYRAMSQYGINVNYEKQTVSYKGSGPNTNSDRFLSSNTVVYGTNNGDVYNSLNSSSNIVIEAGAGDDRVSFDASTTALNVNIDATGNIDTGYVKINKGTQGNLTIGGTKFDDTFYITDLRVLNVNRGIDGGIGSNILNFSKLTAGLDGYVIGGSDYNYKLINMNRYVLTKYNDSVIWVVVKDKEKLPTVIDFNGGTNNKLTLRLNEIASDDLSLLYDISATNNNASITMNSATFSHATSFLNIQQLKMESNKNIASFKAVFNGFDYTGVTDIFTDQIQFGSNFIKDTTFEYKNYILDRFDTSTIVGGVNNLIFSGSRNNAVMKLHIQDSSKQNSNVNITIADAVNITMNITNIARTINYTDEVLSVNTSQTNTQTFKLSKVTQSTITMQDVSVLVVTSNVTMSMFKEIILGSGSSDRYDNYDVDFMGYKGQHGNVTTGEDWVFTDKKLTGIFANKFTITQQNSATNPAHIRLTGTNDTLRVYQNREDFKTAGQGTIGYIDGGAGTNTLLMMGKNEGDFISYIGTSGMSLDSIVITKGKLAAIDAGKNTTPNASDPNSEFFRYDNFQIIDLRGVGVNKNMNNDTIINIVLNSETMFTTVYAPKAKAAVSTQDSMQRTILNAGGYAATGATPTGGFDTGGIYNVSFEYDEDNPGKMNRMMQVEARFENKVFDIHNVQSIYGKKGQQDIVKFSYLNTEQFYDLSAQFSQGKSIGYDSNSTNVHNVENRKKYLYLDLEFTRDETEGSSNNSSANRPESQYDIIDFSSWDVHDKDRVYDMGLEGVRGEANANGLHMLAIGEYNIAGGRSFGVIFIKLSGQQHIYLPQTSIYFGNLSNYTSSRRIILEFPNVVGKEYSATFDNFTSNIQVLDTSPATILSGSQGLSQVANYKLLNFTTLFLDRNGDHRTSNIIIGQDGLFTSNKVHLYLSQKANDLVRPTSEQRTNEYSNNSTSTNNKVDFSNIKSGSHYFSWGAWQDREHQSTEFVSTDKNNKGIASNEYKNFMQDGYTGVGIVFTGDAERAKVGTTDGYSSSVFYRIQNPNFLILTNSNDTFALGKIYSSSTGPIGPMAQANKKTFLKEVRGGAGFNTLLIDSFSADTKTSAGTNQSGKAQGAQGHAKEKRAAGSYQVYNPDWYLRGDTENGHIERVYKIDETFKTDMRFLSVIDDNYGQIVKLGLKAAYNRDTRLLPLTMPVLPNNDFTQSNLAYAFSNASYYDFRKIEVDDYSLDPQNLKIGGYYTGVQDDAIVISAGQSTTGGASYREINLGGRYFKDQTTPTSMESQLIMHQTNGKPNAYKTRIQFINSRDDRVDSNVIVADGYDSNASNYTNYYSYKNWDKLEIAERLNGYSNQAYIVFNTDFSFDKMHGKTFKITTLDFMSSSKVYIFYQTQKYNYNVEELSNSDGEILHKISEKGTDKFFIVHYSLNEAVLFIKYEATDLEMVSAPGFLSQEEIYNLEKYGNLEGIDESNNPFLDSSNYNSESEAGVFSGKQNSEDNFDYSKIYGDGSDGIAVFGMGSNKSKSSQSGDQNYSKSENDHQTQTNSSDTDDDYLLAFKDQNVEYDDLDYENLDKPKEEEYDYRKQEQIKEDTEEENKENEDDKLEDEDEDNKLEDEDEDNFEIQNNLENISFEILIENKEELNINELFNIAEDLLSENIELSTSLNEMVETVSLIEEESINDTNSYDELDSMSFALDSMFSIEDSIGHSEVNADSNSKNKNTNNFSNS